MIDVQIKVAALLLLFLLEWGEELFVSKLFKKLASCYGANSSFRTVASSVGREKNIMGLVRNHSEI